MRWTKKRLAAAAIIGGLVIFAWQVMGQKSTGKIYSGKVHSAILSKSNEWKQYRGKLAVFNYPPEFKINSQEVSGAGQLERVFLVQNLGSGQISLAISNVGNQSLEENSAVVMRRVYANKYQESYLNICNTKFLLFSNKENRELVALGKIGNKALSLAETSSGNENFEEQFTKIAATVECNF